MKESTSIGFRWPRVIFGAVLVALAMIVMTRPKAQEPDPRWWSIQAVDTMKYSRDLSREMLNNTSFNEVIDQQVVNIAQTGATHVAIGTPYDEEFLPIMERWVKAARRYGLNVWFRGNFSGWEKWFEYPAITRDEHKTKTRAFITSNPDFFEDGDIFSPCPECENGGPGDPRHNGDASGHKAFLIELQQLSDEGFSKIGKNVAAGFFSMNGDVARLIMDEQTTKLLGGLVVVDHYVSSPKQLKEDVIALAKQSGGQIILGEFGAPIPDLHGQMTEEAQAAWIGETLRALSEVPEVVGINYWTGVGGSTELWNSSGEARLGVQVLKLFFTPKLIRGTVTDEVRQPIAQVSIASRYRRAIADRSGNFILPSLDSSVELTVQAVGFESKKLQVERENSQITVQLVSHEESTWYKIRKFLLNLFPAS